MEFVVQRDKWLRGGGIDNGQLRNIEGGMCCLGFCALQLFEGSKDDILLKSMPMALATWDKWKDVFGSSQGLLTAIAHTNDSTDIDDEARENRLRELFAEADIDVTFR